MINESCVVFVVGSDLPLVSRLSSLVAHCSSHLRSCPSVLHSLPAASRKRRGCVISRSMCRAAAGTARVGGARERQGQGSLVNENDASGRNGCVRGEASKPRTAHGQSRGSNAWAHRREGCYGAGDGCPEITIVGSSTGDRRLGDQPDAGGQGEGRMAGPERERCVGDGQVEGSRQGAGARVGAVESQRLGHRGAHRAARGTSPRLAVGSRPGRCRVRIIATATRHCDVRQGRGRPRNRVTTGRDGGWQ